MESLILQQQQNACKTKKTMKLNTSNSPAANSPSIEQFDDLLPIRMALPQFRVDASSAQPENLSAVAAIYIDQLLDLGFIYSHELYIENPVGKPENEPARIITYMSLDENVYALITDLYHSDVWVQFTSYYPAGQRVVTTSQPGALVLEPIQHTTSDDELIVQNAGSNTIDSQWKKHRRLTATRFPDANALLVQPDQHLAIERGFYLRYVARLLDNNVLQQTDTQTVRFTRSGARAFHAASTSRSARAPQPNVEEWIGKRGKIPIRPHLNYRNFALAASAVLAVALIIAMPRSEPEPPHVADIITPAVVEKSPAPPAAVAATDTADVSNPTPANEETDPQTFVLSANEEEKTEKLMIATSEDEMWRIAVENAEFFLLSNDGDPAPWIRTARKIAAGFKSNDSRLARTYFLAALLEHDHKVAEQQYNRALSIQTKTLGLYHHETAQTLEALAWIAENDKDALDEAITHQRLAVNIYRDIFGAEAEDTKAALWKLEYFEDRQSGARPKVDSNKRLLPALARFAAK